MKERDEVRAFLNKGICDRCGGQLGARIMSYFTDETICMECSEEEDEIKSMLRDNGKDPRDFEGCGYVPDVEE